MFAGQCRRVCLRLSADRKLPHSFRFSTATLKSPRRNRDAKLRPAPFPALLDQRKPARPRGCHHETYALGRTTQRLRSEEMCAAHCKRSIETKNPYDNDSVFRKMRYLNNIRACCSDKGTFPVLPCVCFSGHYLKITAPFIMDYH